MSADRIPVASERPREWRELGDQLSGIGAQVDPRKLIELLASQLEESLKAEENSVLTLQEAAKASGMSADHLRHLVSSGKLPQAGKRGSPRIRRGDLPRKPGRQTATTYDPTADAIRLMSGGKSA